MFKRQLENSRARTRALPLLLILLLPCSFVLIALSYYSLTPKPIVQYDLQVISRSLRRGFELGVRMAQPQRSSAPRSRSCGGRDGGDAETATKKGFRCSITVECGSHARQGRRRRRNCRKPHVAQTTERHCCPVHERCKDPLEASAECTSIKDQRKITYWWQLRCINMLVPHPPTIRR